MCEKRPTKETYTRDPQQNSASSSARSLWGTTHLTKETHKRGLHVWKKITKNDLHVWKETHKIDIQKRPTKKFTGSGARSLWGTTHVTNKTRKRDQHVWKKTTKRDLHVWKETHKRDWQIIHNHMWQSRPAKAIATLCNNTLQHYATTHCNTLQQHTATHCINTLQHSATTHCNTATTHCNTLQQHTATHCNNTLCNNALQHKLHKKSLLPLASYLRAEFLFCRSLFTHVCLYYRFLLFVSFHACRSLLRVSFETCVVPQSGLGSPFGAHSRLCSCSYMYVSFVGLFYGSLWTHELHLRVEWDRLLAHMYVYVPVHTCTSLS